MDEEMSFNGNVDNVVGERREVGEPSNSPDYGSPLSSHSRSNPRGMSTHEDELEEATSSRAQWRTIIPTRCTVKQQNEFMFGLMTSVKDCLHYQSHSLESQSYCQTIRGISVDPCEQDDINYGWPLVKELSKITARCDRTFLSKRIHHKFLDEFIDTIVNHLMAGRPWLYGNSASTSRVVKVSYDDGYEYRRHYDSFKVKLATKLLEHCKETNVNGVHYGENLTIEKPDGDEGLDAYVKNTVEAFKDMAKTLYEYKGMASDYKPAPSFLSSLFSSSTSKRLTSNSSAGHGVVQGRDTPTPRI